jgi:hypothetical protein
MAMPVDEIMRRRDTRKRCIAAPGARAGIVSRQRSMPRGARAVGARGRGGRAGAATQVCVW